MLKDGSKSNFAFLARVLGLDWTFKSIPDYLDDSL